jgi:excisionase family DNA binding protein
MRNETTIIHIQKPKPMYTIENYKKFLHQSEKINEQAQSAIKIQSGLPFNKSSGDLTEVLTEIQKMAESLTRHLGKALSIEMTIDNLPQVVEQLNDKLENIERLLLSKSNASLSEANDLLTIKQTAEILHLSVPTIYGLVQRREVPVCKRGKRLYFSKQEITDWVMAGRKKTNSEIDAEVDSYLGRKKRRSI